MTYVSTFKSAFFSQFHVSFSSVVSGISQTKCPHILLLFHSSFLSHIQLCLDALLFTVSLYYIVSAAFTSSINGWTEFLTYHPKLFSSILIHVSQLVNPLPPISLLRYTLSTSLLGCSAPCIVINFLVLLTKLFNSSAFHFRIPAPYLITETARVLTAITLFLPFNVHLNISLNSLFLSLWSYQYSISLSMCNQSHQCLLCLAHLGV